MNTSISVQKIHDELYTVRISERDGTETVHEVTVPSDYVRRLNWECTDSSIQVLLQTSFAFLLLREPKEAILQSFTLSLIASYFPEYEDEIRKE